MRERARSTRIAAIAAIAAIAPIARSACKAVVVFAALSLTTSAASAQVTRTRPDSQSLSRDTIAPSLSRMRGEVQRFDLGRYGIYDYRRPVPLRALREVPATVAGTFVLGLDKESLPEWGVVAVSTLGLYAADEYLLDKSRLFARHVGLPPNHPSINLRFAGLKLPLPSTLGSAIYFLGDGATDLLVAGGFLVQGWRKDDNRARTTASEITSGLVSLGVYTQLLKRSFGRQTPSEATEPRGRWRPFPPLGDYNANTPGYDAMPSGHMAAAMSTVEIVALNYPEKRFVRPLGYSLMTLLGFAMVNNGVHWTSDYPLALLIGGGVARVTVARGRAEVRRDGSAAVHRGFSWSPLVTPSAVGVRLGLPY